MLKKTVLFVSLISLFSVYGFAQEFGYKKAQNLAQNFAIGLSMIDSQGVLSSEIPAVTVKYWFDNKTAVEAAFGFTAGDRQDIAYGSGKLLAIIKNYNSLNFYALAFAGFGSSKYSYDSAKGILNLGAGFGVEWFVLDNLSISNEIGIAYFDRADDANQLGIFADWIPKAGIRFYL
ncbi:MAG: hypothetical protein LBT79_02970 [Elusimicrobiota bacterium]|jgi:hypothetical protein|nr:hypothetical protein [Elusimicrobiota bacterium]